MKKWLLAVALVLGLAGCKTELYSGLSETEANQMMALLLYNHITTDKAINKEGVTLTVDSGQFVNAVEILRQNGLPQHKIVAMQDLFPSGQLVTSPEQEAAKLTFLKGQQLEKMIGNMDGVVSVNVSVAVPPVRDGEPDPQPATAAVFVKYSPDTDMVAHAAEIRNLVLNGIPGLSAERVSVVLQRANYHYQPADMLLLGAKTTPITLWVLVGLAIMVGVLGIWWLWVGRRIK